VLTDDLQELFSKLRFSYLEQVTKEKFLRAIVGDPPQIVEHTENVALEAQLAAAKASLKAHKLEVAGMIDEIETRGRDLSERYEAVQLHTTRLRELPSQIVALEESLEGLREATRAADKDKNASLNMPLPATQALLMDRQKELEGLEKQLKSLQQAVPRKTQEAERMENELKPLEVQRAGTVSAAAEARRRREEGERGVGDELELKGRWYRSVETGIRNLVGMGA
jgi:chromosome segregation ATPase